VLMEAPAVLLTFGGILVPVHHQVTSLSWQDRTI
jgi:hypothetical protein